ncbi:DUF924 family protein [Piscinibacter sakaiensis]|uniref:DUF924 family protein n=1 Tax=Piscinibacter sakaiensis TaxID=1547922 RepID=UPI003AADDE46
MDPIDEVLHFWFDELAPAQWWKKDDAVDRQIVERFAPLQRRAAACELFGWRASPRGRLAEVIVLDQFSRNMFRGQPQAFASDPLALALAQTAVEAGADGELDEAERSFLYMPFMHSESAAIHAIGLGLFETLGRADNLDSARRHREIIERFGRYPHRNAILGRPSTPEEIEFLQQPGSSF